MPKRMVKGIISEEYLRYSKWEMGREHGSLPIP